jgi:hypothetical protein
MDFGKNEGKTSSEKYVFIVAQPFDVALISAL